MHLGPLTTLLVQIAVIIIASRLLGVVMRRLGQPLVMAEVLAGILLGPSLFGWLSPEAMTTVFPPTSLPVLGLLSQVGLVLFMFLIGLELDPGLLRGRTSSTIMISHTSIVFPFALGATLAYFIYETRAEAGVELVSFMLFLGVSMSVTAFPVLARILSERNMMTTQVGAIAIACAAVDDVTAWCLLAVVVGVARSGAFVDSLITITLALAFIAFMMFVLRPFLRRVAARVTTPEGLTSNVVAVILLLLLASACTTELIGIHALFGAFLFGAILPKHGELAETLVGKLETVAVVLLLPLFFAFSGLRTQIGLLSGVDDWLLTLVIILLASLGKFGGSTIAARLTGLPWRESSAIGVLMNTRGLMELIVLNIGLDLGVISPRLFTMLVIMALVTTYATGPLLRFVHPAAVSRPSLANMTRPPYVVMTCVSDPTIARGLATVASTLVGKDNKTSRAYALHFAAPTHRPSLARRKRETNEQAPAITSTLMRARELNVQMTPVELASEDPGVDICKSADVHKAGLVLLGVHKPLLRERRLGGTVRQVLARTNTSVGVFVDRGLDDIARVVVVLFDRAEDAAAIAIAHRFAAASNVDVKEVRLAEVTDLAPSRTDLIVVGIQGHVSLGAVIEDDLQRMLGATSASVLAIRPT